MFTHMWNLFNVHAGVAAGPFFAIHTNALLHWFSHFFANNPQRPHLHAHLAHMRTCKISHIHTFAHILCQNDKKLWLYCTFKTFKTFQVGYLVHSYIFDAILHSKTLRCLCIHTAGPWHMRFFRLGKIRIFQIRMTEIQVSRYVICLKI